MASDSDSGLPNREALPHGRALDAAPAAKLDSGVVAIEDVVPKRSAQPRQREGTPPPVEDLVVDAGGGQSAEMLRLLRQPRYFDDDFEAVSGRDRAVLPCLQALTRIQPPAALLQAAMRCFRCGGTGHRERECTLPPRERPCFLCGALTCTESDPCVGRTDTRLHTAVPLSLRSGLFGHVSRECPRELCFNCSMPGHQARNCPVPRGQANPLARCLRCGSRQHELASCDRDYDREDMSLMVCYLCGQQGHLCCDSVGDVTAAEELEGDGDDPTAGAEPSCCRCGGGGHVGSECSVRFTGSSGGQQQLECFRCGKVGHLARNCPMNQSRAGHATAGMGFGGGGGVAADAVWSSGQAAAVTPSSARGAQRLVTWTPGDGSGRHAMSAPRGGTHQRWD